MVGAVSASSSGSTPAPATTPIQGGRDAVHAPGGTELQRWIRPALLIGGGAVLIEALVHLPGLGGGALLTAGALGGGWWLLSGRNRPLRPRLPSTLNGWVERCEALLEQFDQLQDDQSEQEGGGARRRDLELLSRPQEKGAVRLTVVGSRPPQASLRPRFASALRNRSGLALQWGHALPATSSDWRWPVGFEASDAFLYHLHLPLQAVDLRWLEALPNGMPLWLLIQTGQERDRPRLEAELLSQCSAGSTDRMLFWDGQADSLDAALSPLASWMMREASRLRQATPLRCLEALHRRWQADLEQLRRRKWVRLQQRTQWVVAAGVFAAPLPSLDLLVLTAANGLMLREMAALWGCPWSLEQLRLAAQELGRAALALGVIEWSSQALIGAARIEGATWLVGGAVQALSAAYLTRVVSRAMADTLALSAGVSEPDLEAIKRQAPLLVARAAEAEKLDWSLFLRQGRHWLEQTLKGGGAPGQLQATS